MPVPNTFANATTSIPLSQLDANFATAITLGNTSIQLGNTVTTLNNMTLANVTISTGTANVANATLSGNLTFTGTGNRITGDFSNTTVASRVAFQTSTTNSNTIINAIPSGTGTNADFRSFNNSDPTNAAFFQVGMANTGAEARLNSGISGTGTYVPMTFVTGGTERMRVDSSGNVGIGTSSPGQKLAVVGSNNSFADTIYVNNTATGSGAWARIGLQAGSNYALIGNDNAGDLQVYNAANANMVFSTNATERMRISSSGNVGIGTSSPTYKLQVGNHNGYNDQFSVYNDGTFSTGGVNLFNYYNGTTNICGFKFASVSSTTGAILMYTNAGSGVVERARIDSNGNLLVGKTTTANDITTVGAFIQNNGKGVFTTTDVVQPLVVAKNANTAGALIEFYYNGATVGTITTNGTGVTYGTASDYRLKNSTAPLSSGLNSILSLRPVTYKWNVDGSNGEGFIAHELQSVIPAAVTGEKDAVNEDGSIKPQGVDYSKIVVHLVAAIQELSAKVAALEAKP